MEWHEGCSQEFCAVLLYLLAVQVRPFQQVISLDFIEGLPLSNSYKSLIYSLSMGISFPFDILSLPLEWPLPSFTMCIAYMVCLVPSFLTVTGSLLVTFGLSYSSS